MSTILIIYFQPTEPNWPPTDQNPAAGRYWQLPDDTIGSGAPPLTPNKWMDVLAGPPTQSEIDAVINPPPPLINPARIYEVAIGDGIAQTYSVTHNLGTLSVQVEVVDTIAPFEIIFCDLVVLDVNSIALTFAQGDIPAVDRYRVSVVGK